MWLCGFLNSHQYGYIKVFPIQFDFANFRMLVQGTQLRKWQIYFGSLICIELAYTVLYTVYEKHTSTKHVNVYGNATKVVREHIGGHLL